MEGWLFVVIVRMKMIYSYLTVFLNATVGEEVCWRLLRSDVRSCSASSLYDGAIILSSSLSVVL